MPCKDVTEVIRVVVDNQDRLLTYSFSKRTCGQGVGAESLILDALSGRCVEELLQYDAETYLRDNPVQNADPEEYALEEFLSLKHFFAVQGALEVLTGKEPGRKGDPCTAAKVVCDGDETTITGHIDLDIVTEKIKACGNCGSCGSSPRNGKRRKSASAAV